MVVHIKETRPISVSDNNDNRKPTKSSRPPKSYNNTHFTFVGILSFYTELRESPFYSSVVITAYL